MPFLNYVSRPSIITLLISVILLSAALAVGDDMEDLKKPPLLIDFNDVVEGNGLSARDSDATLKIAVAAMISPQYTYHYYVELLDLIGERVGRDVDFIQKETYAEVNEMLRQKELDMAFVCSGPYASGREEFNMEIIAVPVCHGEKVYYSYFIAARGKGIDSFDDLMGKTFAFTDPLSNTGYMVPAYYLAKRNETPETFFKRTFFTHSHDNSIRAVADGLADGAAVDSLIYEFMKVKNPDLTANTLVIDRSEPYGIPPVVVNPSMGPELKNRLKEVFFSVHEDPKGKDILKNLMIDRFVEGNDEDYNTVRELQQYLNNRQTQ